MELLLQGIDLIDIPLIIYNHSKKEILYRNAKAENFVKEILQKELFNKFDLLSNREILFTMDDPFPQIYIGKIKVIDDENFLIYFEEIKKDKPFSGFLFEVFENLPVLVFFVKNGKVIYVNKSIQTILSLDREQILNKRMIEDLIWDFDKPKAKLYWKQVLSGAKEEKVIFAIEDKFGRVRNFLWNCFLTLDWQGENIIVCIALDISEYLELSQKIEKLHKSQTFVEFLRGLVHDYNNLLQIILDYTKKLKVSPVTKMEELIDCIEKNIYAWIDINRILLDYTKEVKELKHKKLDLIEFLKENLDIFQLVLGNKIRLYLDLGYFKKLFTYGDYAFWRYILLNLLVNAKDAILAKSDKGDIYISINRYEDLSKYKSFIKLSIKDTGCGIPEEVLPKIFDPFYTTKEKGSGLGLFLVNHHIKTLEGFIEVESSVGKGTTFHIYVPLLAESSLKQDKDISLKDKTIIIVDDEEEIRVTIKEMLEEKGCRVYAFESGEKLFERVDELEKPDIFLIDLNLPDIDGRTLSFKIKEKFPSTKFLYLTGDIFALSELPENGLLLKPFKLDEMLNKIMHLLKNE